MYSALKVSGEPLYKLARRGVEVERKPRKVTVWGIELVRFDIPFVILKIACSKGTYIRSICNDLGNALGVGAYMAELERTRVGDFRIEDSARLEELPQKTSALHSVDSVLRHLPDVTVTGDALRKAKNGNPLPLLSMTDQRLVAGSSVRLKDDKGRIFGIGKVTMDSIKIDRLLFL